MLRLAVVASLALAPVAAHAMGSDVSFELVAWNDDGSAALLHRTTSRDGDHSSSYVVLADEPKALDIAVSATQRWSAGRDVEQIDAATCTRALRELESALVAKRFRDVSLHVDACSGTRKNAITAAAGLARDAERSWIAFPQGGRAASAREQAAVEVMKQAAPGYHPQVVLEPTVSCEGIDVAARGPLVLVFSTYTCGSPMRTKVRAFASARTGFVERVSVY